MRGRAERHSRRRCARERVGSLVRLRPAVEEVLDSSPADPALLVPGNGPLNVGADQVWALGFTGQGVVVMNADSGINPTHGDLAGRLWINPGEIPNNNTDDDSNGKIDDVNGWNFGSNNNVLLNTGDSHGTNTAGCLVADGTCTGTIYGMAPGAKVMTGRLAVRLRNGTPSSTESPRARTRRRARTPTRRTSTLPRTTRCTATSRETSLAAGLIRTNSTSNDGSRLRQHDRLATPSVQHLGSRVPPRALHRSEPDSLGPEGRSDRGRGLSVGRRSPGVVLPMRPVRLVPPRSARGQPGLSRRELGRGQRQRLSLAGRLAPRLPQARHRGSDRDDDHDGHRRRNLQHDDVQRDLERHAVRERRDHALEGSEPESHA